MDFKDLPTFKPKKDKLLAAILFLMEEAAKAGLKLTTGEIVKSLFIADDRHLAEFGRPITFDNYVAMTNGPVGDLASNMLNDDWRVVWSEFGLDRAPWSTEELKGWTYYQVGDVAADRRKLSRSDVDELLAAMAYVTSVGFYAVSEKTHEHPAWISAWSSKEISDRAAAMDWRDFPEVDGSLASDLVIASWNAS